MSLLQNRRSSTTRPTTPLSPTPVPPVAPVMPGASPEEPTPRALQGAPACRPGTAANPCSSRERLLVIGDALIAMGVRRRY